MQPVSRTTTSPENSTDYFTYISLLTNILVHKLPDFENVNINEVRRIAEFSLTITDVVLNTWREEEVSDQRRRPQQRAA